MVKGCIRRWRLVTSSVPQGSVLGLALINTFINNKVKSTYSKFADDMKLSRASNQTEGKDAIQGRHQIALEHKLLFCFTV